MPYGWLLLPRGIGSRLLLHSGIAACTAWFLQHRGRRPHDVRTLTAVSIIAHIWSAHNRHRGLPRQLGRVVASRVLALEETDVWERMRGRILFACHD